ncbi:MAG: hypothetical protein LBH05_07865 [Deferribacteraceae bacterium]|nr:hypothetical protein [Deferribacteraceae bacterium]
MRRNCREERNRAIAMACAHRKWARHPPDEAAKRLTEWRSGVPQGGFTPPRIKPRVRSERTDARTEKNK